MCSLNILHCCTCTAEFYVVIFYNENLTTCWHGTLYIFVLAFYHKHFTREFLISNYYAEFKHDEFFKHKYILQRIFFINILLLSFMSILP